MNHVYRLVWSVSRQVWVPASELTNSRKKGASRSAKALLLACLVAPGLHSSLVFAKDKATTVVPINGNADAYISANGVPVVNINTANSSGLSHNTYSRYDVESNGLVLNNGNSSQLSRQSELAGQVAANLNLRREATVILNEVVSTNRSTLAGFTEVLGGKADVIVANPYGISCDGCGFINTDRVTLTTGVSDIGIDGSLSGFSVNRGDISIEGAGANASSQQIFDLLARSVNISANINVSDAGELGITTGSNEWDYATRNVTGNSAGEGDVPSYALDSSALGGMYAGRIRLIATEAGVGVRMLGDVAASADDFTLTSAGKIEIQSDISAQQDLKIASTSATGVDDLYLNDANLSAQRDMSLVIENGDINVSEGTLYASNDLFISGSTLTDNATSDNTRFAGSDNSIIANYVTAPCVAEDCHYINSMSIDGSIWGAGESFSASAEQFAVGSSGATLYAGTILDLSASRNLNFGTGVLSSVGDMTLSAGSSITTEAGDAQGIQSTEGNVSLSASLLNNAGTISSDSGGLTANVGYLLANTGTLHAETSMEIADEVGGRSVNLTNDGAMIVGGGDLSIRATTIENRVDGNVVATGGSFIRATSLTNEGTFIAADSLGANGIFSLDSLENSGTLQVTGSLLNLDVFDTLANTGDLLASNRLLINAGTAALDITNSESGLVQAGGEFRIAGDSVSFDTQAGDVIVDSADINIFSLVNSGRLQSSQDMILSLGTAVTTTNTGIVHAGGNLNWTTVGRLLNESGSILSALENLSLDSEGIYNNGTVYAGNNFTASSVNYFSNFRADSTINVGGDITINAARFINSGLVYAGSDINIASSYWFSNEIYSEPSTYLDWANATVVQETLKTEFEQCTLTCSFPSRLDIYEDTIRVNEIFASEPSTIPEIIAGNDMRIDIGSVLGGRNYLGLISAVNTLTLDGAVSFTNEAFSRNSVEYKRRYYKWKFDGTGITTQWLYAFANEFNYIDPILPYMAGLDNSLSFGLEGSWFCITGSCSSASDSSAMLNTNREVAYKYYAGGESVLQTFGSNIRAGNITGTLGNLNNLGITIGSNDGPSISDDSSSVALTPLSDGSGISFDGVSITIPTNPNGFFVPTQETNANYLIETNPLFGAGFNFVGSDYLLDHYGYDPARNIRRLGDANYEAYLIRQQLIAQTGNSILTGQASEEEQLISLMDNALEEVTKAKSSEDENFRLGEALNDAQIAKLENDMVWMVATTVAGKRVLTPVVYLAPTTRNEINVGAVIGGENINLNLARLTNTGGTIIGSETNKVVSQGNITNTSGTIRGGNVDLSSTDGSIINETAVKGHGDNTSYATDIGKTATIESTNTLNLDAGKDIKVIGAEVTALGDGTLTAGGSITVDTIVDKTVTSVGTAEVGILSYSTTNTNTLTEKNKGSAINIGGNGTVVAQEVLSIRGSSVDIAGEALLDGKKGLKIMDAVDKERVTKITDKSELLGSESDGELDADPITDPKSKSSATHGPAYAKAAASAEEKASAEGEADFKISENSRIVTTSGSNTSVGSSIKVGGKLTTKSEEGTLTVKGSDVEYGSGMLIDAKEVEILAGQNEEWSDTTTTKRSVGIYTEGEAEANAGADAAANYGALGIGNDASASASVSAEASGTVTMGMRVEKEVDTSYTLTNRGSSFKSDGNLVIKADEGVTFVGAKVKSEGGISIDAKNISNLAAKDIHNTSHSKTTETVGLYLDGSASAEAEVNAGLSAGASNSASGGASAGGEVEVGAGLRVHTESESETMNSTTHVGNSFETGGDFKRTATDTIVDQATEVEAGGNIEQRARVIRDEAVHDVVTKTTESEEADIKVGAYAGGSAEGSAEADAAALGRTDKGTGKAAEKGAGFSAKGEYNEASGFSEEKTAVTSKFKSGGNISSHSDEGTTLVGTSFESGGDTSIQAATLDYQAAQNSTVESGSSNELAASAKIAVYGSAGVKADAEYAHETTGSESTTAKVGSINAGGNLTITTTGDATFEGTSLNAGNKAEIDAGGNVDFNAAKSTESSTEATLGLEASFSSTDKNEGIEGSAEGGYTEDSDDTAVVGKIAAGSGGIVIKSGNKVSLEGTDIDSSGVTSISATTVELSAAEVNETSSSIGGSIEAMDHEKGPGLYKGGIGEGGVALSGGYADKVTSTTTNINSAGGVEINAAKIVNQEATLNSNEGSVNLSGNVVKTETNKRDVSISESVGYKTNADTNTDAP